MADVFSVETHDGTVLEGYMWAAEKPAYNLCIMTGMCEYAKRYERFALWMSARGINVMVLDALGQGRNAVSVERQQEWPADAFATHVEAIHLMNMKAKKNGLPTFQMGHSMGSFLTQALMERYPESVDGIILCGSNGGQNLMMKFGAFVANLRVRENNRNVVDPTLQKLGLGSYAKAIRGRKTDCDWLSVNEENVQAYIADPWCGHPNTGGFWKEFLKGMAEIWSGKALSKISEKERVLIIGGDEDPVGRNGAGPRWLEKTYKRLNVSYVRLILYSHMRHEILNETDREMVYEDILFFMTR